MSVTTIDIKVEKIEKSRIAELDQNNLQFGRLYSDHMLEVDYENGQWGQAKIVPFGNISMNPATSVLHYGQAIFEGVKAYRMADGSVGIFRPKDNWLRMNRSAERMAMPAIPEEIFMDGIHELIKLDQAWVPNAIGTSLYLRPFMIAMDEFIGVKPATKFKFMVITSPAGPYYSHAVSIFVQDEYVRAVEGGIGFTKAAGNYGACMYPTQKIQEAGYDQNLWMDSKERKYVQEIGTMNVFFKIGDKFVTPDLSCGTILAGVTRDSVLTILKEKGFSIEERKISIQEIEAAHQNGELKEAFGTGTAASIAPIGKLTFHKHVMELPPVESWESMPMILKEINDTRYGIIPDKRNWVHKVI